MEIVNKGFEITDICPKINGLVFDGAGLRIDEAPDMHSVGLNGDDVTKLIEALTEARRLMNASGTTAAPAGPAPRLKDCENGTWSLEANGVTYRLVAGALAGWTRAKIDQHYGPVTEIRD